MILHKIPVLRGPQGGEASRSGINKDSQLAKFKELLVKATAPDARAQSASAGPLAEGSAPSTETPSPSPPLAIPPLAVGEIVPAGGNALPLAIPVGPPSDSSSTVSSTRPFPPGQKVPTAARPARLGWIPNASGPAPTGSGAGATSALPAVPIPKAEPVKATNQPVSADEPPVASLEAAGRPRVAMAAAEAGLAPEPEVPPATVTPSARADPLAPFAMRPETNSVPSWTVAQPIRTPEWGNALGQRITWMTHQEVPVAQLRLNPPELGPLEVRIAVNDTEASVHFGVQHATVREAIDTAIPRLRDMLENAGLQLVDVDVTEHGDRRNGSPLADAEELHGEGDDTSTSPEDPGGAPVATRVHTGFIDRYV